VAGCAGVRVSAMAYPLFVLALTGSPAQAGLVEELVDRWPRKRPLNVLAPRAWSNWPWRSSPH
jgi:hypothetical protein